MARGPLIAVFVVMCSLFAATTILASWYTNERFTRAGEYFTTGERLEKQDQTEAAMEAYRNALEIAPKSEYRLALAQALIKSGRPEGASLYLAELLRTDVASGEPNLLLARIAAKDGHTDAAINYYQRAIYGYWPHNAQQNRLAARWELIGVLENAHLEKQVIAQLLELSEQAGDNVATRVQAADRLLTHNAPTQAEAVFHDALRLEPGNAEAQAGLAEAELALARYADAQAAFRRAIREGENNGQTVRAYALVNEILALDPMRHDLTPFERYRRSLMLVERSAAIAAKCAQPGAANPLQDQASAAQRAHVRARDLETAADANIRLAEQLYASKGDCRQSDPALARVLAGFGAR